MSVEPTRKNGRPGAALATAPASVFDVGAARRAPSSRRGLARAFFAQPLPALATAYIALIGFIALWVWIFNPLQPNALDLSYVLQGPSPSHIFGTDQLGRDVFSRMLHATLISVEGTLEGVGVVVALGLLPALVAGYFGGRIDAVLVRVADAFIVFPGIILAIAVVGILGPSLAHAMLAVGIVAWPGLFRVVRGTVFQVREEAYVAAARTMGASHWYIITHQILPVVLTPLFVNLALVASVMLLAEAGLSFIGLGIQPPYASWGSMISDGERFLGVQPWLAVFPGIAITLAALSFNTISDGLSRAYTRRGLSAPDA